MQLNFVTQYMLANAGTEVPPRYTRWCAVALLSAAIGRRAYVDHGHYVIFPWMYFCLVGEAGNGKTTAMDQARDMYLASFPDMPGGGDISSREEIIQFMASDKGTRFYKNEQGVTVEWKPYVNFISELSNFLSFAPNSMIEFLTAIFDRPRYKSTTLKRGIELIENPHVSILACTTPTYIHKTLKTNLIGGGFSRRLLFHYDIDNDRKIITFPVKAPESIEAEKWCIDHLRSIGSSNGHKFTWTQDAREFFDDWNIKRERPKDEFLSGYHEKKDIIVQKIAMCLAYAIPNLPGVLTQELMQAAIAYIENNEDTLPRLTLAAGRNQLAIPQSKLILLLESQGGLMQEKVWHKFGAQDMNEVEYHSTKRMLITTDQIVEFPLDGKAMIATRAKFDELKKKEKPTSSPSQHPSAQ